MDTQSACVRPPDIATLARHGLLAALGDVAEDVVLAQPVDAFFERGGAPEAALRRLRLAEHPGLLPVLHEEDVPGADRHDQQNDDRSLGDEVAVAPIELKTAAGFRRLRRSRLGGAGRRGAVGAVSVPVSGAGGVMAVASPVARPCVAVGAVDVMGAGAAASGAAGCSCGLRAGRPPAQEKDDGRGDRQGLRVHVHSAPL